MPVTAPTEDLARALSLTSDQDPDALYGLLDGREPQTADALVDLARRLNAERNRMERGGDYGRGAEADAPLPSPSAPEPARTP
jgi:hypothetical protein